MKKLFAIILIVMLLAVFPLASFAETSTDTDVSTETNSEGNSTPETESPAEGEISAPTATENIVNYIQTNLEEILVMVGMAFAAVYTKINNGKLGGTLGTLNGNAVSIAKSAADISTKAFSKIEEYAGKIESLEGTVNALLDKLAKSEEEKRKLEEIVGSIESVMRAVKGAAVEASNEVAELILLANLPTSVKDELYSKHLKSIKEIEDEGGDGNGSNKA